MTEHASGSTAIGGTTARAEQGEVATDDPFDTLLGLEEQFYEEGYALGKQDGTRAGQAEGRGFGMQHGFERFADMGRMHGRATVWHSRLKQNGHQEPRGMFMDPSQRPPGCGPLHTKTDNVLAFDFGGDPKSPEPQCLELLEQARLKPLSSKPRLEKHLGALYAWSEPESLSFENKDADVAEFEERTKRVQAKEAIISRMVGETAYDHGRRTEPLEIDMQSIGMVKENKGSSNEIEDVDVSRLL